MSTAIKRACDACHRRKVKCDGINPCRNCSSAQLSCTYNAIPQKKGPKGSRAKVISELRETQRQSGFSARVQSRLNNMTSSLVTTGQQPRLLSNDTVKACMDFFFANVFQSIPILNRQRLEQDAFVMEPTFDTHCLLSSLCAFMMLQPGIAIQNADTFGPDRMVGNTILTSTLLLDETLRYRKNYDYLQTPNLYTIATSYFLFACYYGLDMQDKAWLNLREATSLAHLVRMNKEETYLTWDNVEASCRRRLYWLLFVAERSYALLQDRPLSLKPCINPPSSADEPSLPLSRQLVGFSRLVVMFRPFNDSFVELWNKTRMECVPPVVEALQRQHGDMISTMVATDPQLCDQSLNKRWLQSLAWHINLSNGNGTSQVGDVGNLSYTQMDVSHEIILMAASFSTQDSTNLLGTGLVEGLITITSDLSDVLALLPSSSNPFIASPRNQLDELFNILAMLRVGKYSFTPLLLAKVHDILPRLANPILQSAPDSTCEIDIFDGFGNAGMAQPAFSSTPLLLSPSMDYNNLTARSDILSIRPVIDSNIACVSQVGSGPGGPKHTQLFQQMRTQAQSYQPLYRVGQCFPYSETPHARNGHQYLKQHQESQAGDLNLVSTPIHIHVNDGVDSSQKMVAAGPVDPTSSLTNVFDCRNFRSHAVHSLAADDSDFCPNPQSQHLVSFPIPRHFQPVQDFQTTQFPNGQNITTNNLKTEDDFNRL